MDPEGWSSSLRQEDHHSAIHEKLTAGTVRDEAGMEVRFRHPGAAHDFGGIEPAANVG